MFDHTGEETPHLELSNRVIPLFPLQGVARYKLALGAQKLSKIPFASSEDKSEIEAICMRMRLGLDGFSDLISYTIERRERSKEVLEVAFSLLDPVDDCSPD